LLTKFEYTHMKTEVIMDMLYVILQAIEFIEDADRLMLRLSSKQLFTAIKPHWLKLPNICTHATNYGNLNMLKIGIKMKHSTMPAFSIAARIGHEHIVKYIYLSGAEWRMPYITHKNCKKIVEYIQAYELTIVGHMDKKIDDIEMLEMMRPKWHPNILRCIAINGNLPALKLLFPNCPKPSDLTTVIGNGCSSECIQYFMSTDYAANCTANELSQIYTGLAECANEPTAIECANLLLNTDIKIPIKAIRKVIYNQGVKLLKLFLKKCGRVVLAESVAIAIRYGDPMCLQCIDEILPIDAKLASDMAELAAQYSPNCLRYLSKIGWDHRVYEVAIKKKYVSTLRVAFSEGCPFVPGCLNRSDAINSLLKLATDYRSYECHKFIENWSSSELLTDSANLPKN